MAKPVNVQGTLAAVLVGTDVSLSDSIDVRTADHVFVAVPADSSITSLTVHTAATASGSYQPLHDADGAVVVTVAAGKTYEVAALGRWPGHAKFVGNVAGVVVAYGSRATG